jgi:hypothetical protein
MSPVRELKWNTGIAVSVCCQNRGRTTAIGSSGQARQTSNRVSIPEQRS